MGNVFMPKFSSWKPELMSQLMRFPAGKYDDAVDVCSLIGRGLEHARVPVAPKKRVGGIDTGGHFRADGDSWLGT